MANVLNFPEKEYPIETLKHIYEILEKDGYGVNEELGLIVLALTEDELRLWHTTNMNSLEVLGSLMAGTKQIDGH